MLTIAVTVTTAVDSLGESLFRSLRIIYPSIRGVFIVSPGQHCREMTAADVLKSNSGRLSGGRSNKTLGGNRKLKDPRTTDPVHEYTRTQYRKPPLVLYKYIYIYRYAIKFHFRITYSNIRLNGFIEYTVYRTARSNRIYFEFYNH